MNFEVRNKQLSIKVETSFALVGLNRTANKKEKDKPVHPGFPSHKKPLPPQPKSHIIEIAFTRGVFCRSAYTAGGNRT